MIVFPRHAHTQTQTADLHNVHWCGGLGYFAQNKSTPDTEEEGATVVCHSRSLMNPIWQPRDSSSSEPSAPRTGWWVSVTCACVCVSVCSGRELTTTAAIRRPHPFPSTNSTQQNEANGAACLSSCYDYAINKLCGTHTQTHIRMNREGGLGNCNCCNTDAIVVRCCQARARDDERNSTTNFLLLLGAFPPFWKTYLLFFRHQLLPLLHTYSGSAQGSAADVKTSN